MRITMERELNQQAHVEVRALKTFGISERLIEPGESIIVSQSRADYLKFFGLVELL